MPCWYFEKKEIKNSPTYRDGIDSGTEARYRREGARFIVDAGTKLGLRHDTCATGVVYFHRFYMFHSFKDFPRYVTASCCLFLAGKVEETPKKCKDIIKISQQILKPKQFAQFGNDPKEEVMTLERILLQTIKFDLQAEHPYAYLLKYAKLIKVDKEKVQKLVQMAWTFINDSLCTTLCLQWEPEIIATSLMYLGTRLNKMDINDWNGRTSGTKIKWWEAIVADLTVELMEDICHQVLDLYSPSNQVTATESGESPPPPPPAQNPSRTPNSMSGDRKRSLQSTPSEQATPGGQSAKSVKLDHTGNQSKKTPQKNEKGRESSMSRVPSQSLITDPAQGNQPTQTQAGVAGQDMYGANPSNPNPPAASYPPTSDFSQYNPYVSANQYQSSFMSGEGAQNLQNIMGTQSTTYTQPANSSQYSNYSQPPPPVAGGPPPPAGQYNITPGAANYPPGYNPSQYPASAIAPGPAVSANRPGFQQQTQSQQFQGAGYTQYQQYQNYQQPSQGQQPGYERGQFQGSGAYSGSSGASGPRHRSSQPSQQQRHPQPRSSSALTTVRITGR